MHQGQELQQVEGPQCPCPLGLGQISFRVEVQQGVEIGRLGHAREDLVLRTGHNERAAAPGHAQPGVPGQGLSEVVADVVQAVQGLPPVIP